MWKALRKAVSNQVEALLRWLTASVIRSTAIFVILTFVPILLLTYYIVATSIRGSKATAAAADQQVEDFASSLLKANFRGEREALTGAADESTLDAALSASLARPSPAAARRQQQTAAQAAASLTRLHRRRQEMLAIALYRADGERLALAPDDAPLPDTLAAPQLPAWFTRALGGQNSTSPVLAATDRLPRRLAFAVPVNFTPPRTAPAGTPSAAVLVGWLPTRVVDDWVSHINSGPDRFLYVIDAQRQVVAGPAGGPFPSAAAGQLPAAVAALAGRTGSGEYVTAIQFESHAISYAALPDVRMALLLVRPVRFGFYIYRVFYDKLAFIAVIIFLLAVATGLLLRSAFRFYQRYNLEVESGRA
ncbi:MAG TPA: cache domain-containing protein, partial [Terriglobales bacterium]|nr:cache domain-containing protein [Terriglobales bacterium]